MLFRARANMVSVGFTLEGCLSLSLQRKGRSVCAGNALVVRSIHTVRQQLVLSGG